MNFLYNILSHNIYKIIELILLSSVVPYIVLVQKLFNLIIPVLLLVCSYCVIIYIIDQGKGISTKVREKIFERFYTDGYHESGYHSGLGLSISKKIMESFFGSIELSNYDLKGYNGACFKLKLPLKD